MSEHNAREGALPVGYEHRPDVILKEGMERLRQEREGDVWMEMVDRIFDRRTGTIKILPPLGDDGKPLMDGQVVADLIAWTYTNKNGLFRPDAIDEWSESVVVEWPLVFGDCVIVNTQREPQMPKPLCQTHRRAVPDDHIEYLQAAHRHKSKTSSAKCVVVSAHRFFMKDVLAGAGEGDVYKDERRRWLATKRQVKVEKTSEEGASI